MGLFWLSVLTMDALPGAEVDEGLSHVLPALVVTRSLHPQLRESDECSAEHRGCQGSCGGSWGPRSWGTSAESDPRLVLGVPEGQEAAEGERCAVCHTQRHSYICA